MCLDVPMIRELMAGSYQRAGGRSFRWSLLSPSRGTEQGVFRRTYVRGSIPIDKASLRASRPKTTSLFLQLSLCVCPSRTQCWCICIFILIGMKPKPSRMLSTSWRNSSLSNWRYLHLPALGAVLNVFAQEHVDCMDVIIHLSMSIQGQVDSLCRSTPAQNPS